MTAAMEGESAAVSGRVPLRVDQSQALARMSVAELLASDGEGMAVAVPELEYDVRRHPLAVLSSLPDEAALYADRHVVAPSMTMERLCDHWWFPEQGYLIGRDGRVWRHSTLGTYSDPDYQLTGAVERTPEGLVLDRDKLAGCPVIDEPVAIVSHYASHNYGHFLLDMAPWIHALAGAAATLVSRPLLDWHKPIYRRLGRRPEAVRIVDAPVVRLRNALVSSRHLASGTYAASPRVGEAFAAIRREVERRGPWTRSLRVLVVRGPCDKRQLLNRADVVRALAARGFTVVRPDHLSFDEQVATFAHAQTIVVEFGAAAVGLGFSAPGTRVVEIVPEGQNDPWSLHLCAALGLEHVPLFFPVADEARTPVTIGGRAYANVDFSYRARLETVIDVVDRLLCNSA
jgi:capsular polysaccharide biosynthesis protein